MGLTVNRQKLQIAKIIFTVNRQLLKQAIINRQTSQISFTKD